MKMYQIDKIDEVRFSNLVVRSTHRYHRAVIQRLKFKQTFKHHLNVQTRNFRL